MRENKPNFPGLVLGLVMHVSGLWIFWIFVFNMCLYIYKGIYLPYAGPYFPLDVCFYVSWGLIGWIRHAVGDRGTARMSPVALIWFFLLSVLSAVASSYFAFLQTYTLRIENLFNVFCLAIEIVEAILSMAAAVLYIKQQSV